MYHNTLKEVFNMKKNKLSLITLIISASLMIACGGKTSSSSNGNSSSGSNSSANGGSSSVGSESELSIIPSSTSSNGGTGSYNYNEDSHSSNPISSSEPAPASSSNSEPASSNNSAPSSSSDPAPISSSNSSAPSISSSEISSSINSGSTSSQPIVIVDDTLDGQIAQFVDDLGIDIPAVNNYGLSFTVIYYYAYQEYMILAQGDDLNGSIEAEYLNKVNASNLVSQNDDYFYTVEEYGYLFSDEEGVLSLNFYTADGVFYFTLSRYDGGFGSLEVGDIDTSWYVDYINFQGMEYVDDLPINDIKECLGLDPNLEIKPFPVSEFIIGFQEAYLDENESYFPDTFYVVLEGDQAASCVEFLKLNGFVAELYENIGQEFDWETFEYVEYTYYTGEAYDADKSVYISIFPDQSENTIITFNRFEDVFSAEKTSNTDWTDDEKALMNETLHQVLPFMAFGEDYQITDESDEEWDLLILTDSYFEDLSEDYISVLLANGFEEYDDPDWGLLYRCDNGFVYIEIFVDYYNGHYFEIYFSESRIPAVTALALNETALDIVNGASFQLEANLTPKDGNPALTWSSNNEDVATVNANGVVSISDTAAIGSTAVITATALGGVSASCTFTIVADEVTAIKFTQDSYSLIPGGDSIQTCYNILPIGVSALGTISYGIKDDGSDVTGIVYDILSASADAVAGTTFSIYAEFNGTIRCYATVTVLSAHVTHTLTREAFGIQKADYSKYLDYSYTTDDGASYQAACAGNNGIQLRTKNDPSGVIGHLEGRTCQSITITFDPNTEVPNAERGIEIYASNSAFSIADMFSSNATKVGTIMFDKNNLTQTYTFTGDYSYIGFRSVNGAVYLSSVDIVW